MESKCPAKVVTSRVILFKQAVEAFFDDYLRIYRC